MKKIMLYTDGSCIPNPGHGGWGFYGVLKSTVVNGYGIVPPDNKGVATNNRAEIMGVTKALNYALTLSDLTHCHLLTDSKYVLSCIESSDIWIKCGWTLTNGNPVANKDLLKPLIELVVKAKNTFEKLTFKWVKGHHISEGNKYADTNANLGRLLNDMKTDEGRSDILTECPIKPDKPKQTPTTISPLLGGKYYYFLTNKPVKEDSGLYHYNSISLKNKKEDGFKFAGTRSSEGYYTLLTTHTESKQLSTIMAVADRQAHTANQPVLVNLDICRKTPIQSESEVVCIDQLITTRKGTLLANIITPPKNVFNISTILFLLEDLLSRFNQNDPTLGMTDISESFTHVSKTGRVSMCSSYPVGITELTVSDINLPNNLSVKNVKLTVNIDIPVRTIFSRSIKKDKTIPITVTVITWIPSKDHYSLAVIIQRGEETLIQMSPDVNLRPIN